MLHYPSRMQVRYANAFGRTPRSPRLSVLLVIPLAHPQGSAHLSPDLGYHPDPTKRLISSTGNTVIFQLTNNGSIDTHYSVACSRTGRVSAITSCSLPLPILIPNETRSITVTFSTEAGPGLGEVLLTATPTAPAGPAAPGHWTVTVVSPTGIVSPDGTSLVVPGGQTGRTQVLAVSNQTSASVPYTFQTSCAGSVSSCVPAPGSATLTGKGLTGDSTNVTVTYNTGTSGTGRVGLLAKYGAIVVDSGYVTLGIANALVSPDGRTLVRRPSTVDTQRFVVRNVAALHTNFALAAACQGTATGGPCQAVPSVVSLWPAGVPGDSAVASVIYTTASTGDTGRAILRAQFDGVTTDSGYARLRLSATPDSLTPEDSLVTVVQSSVNNRTIFTLRNRGVLSGVYSMTLACTGTGVACTGLSRSSVTIPGGSSDTVSAGYNASATLGQTAKVQVNTAAGGVTMDSGWVNVTVTGAMAAPAINTVSYNPGVTVARDQCLTIALGPAEAAECGDLRVVYQVPIFRTANVARAVTLHYLSGHASPRPQVAVRVTVPASTQLPEYIEATLKVGGVERGKQRWPGTAWLTVGVPRWIRVRDTVQPAPATGIQVYTVEVRAIRGGTQLLASTTQPVLVVNRTTSPFGRGWWVAGLEQIQRLGNDSIVWVGGDGSARLYTRPIGSAVAFGTPGVTYPDSIRAIGAEFVRALPDSVKVVFNAAGRHVRTVNRLGHTTRFVYDASGRLDSLEVPTFHLDPTVRRSWKFLYGDTHTLLLDGIRPQTTIWHPGGPTATVDSIVGVSGSTGGDSVTYRYASGTGLMTTRTDRRLAVRRFTFDSAAKVRRAALGPNGPSTTLPDSIITSLIPVEGQGLVGESVDSVRLHTSLDGPRRPPPDTAGVADTTAFWVNRLGAPYRIVNASRDSTGMRRDSTAFAGTVTRLRTVTGQILQATYDSRGRIKTLRDMAYPADSVTAYNWHAGWDQLTSVTPPTGGGYSFSVDAQGNRAWQQDARGDSVRVNFTYDAATKQVASIAGPGASARLFQYDLRGNLTQIVTALGFQTRFLLDVYRRVISTQRQIDGTQWQRDSVQYDLRDRDTLSLTQSGVSEWVRVSKTFNRENGLESVLRTFSPDPSPAIGALTSSWTYDLAGRLVTETSPGVSLRTIRYDAGGNDTAVVMPRGDILRSRFDAQDRLVRRAVPAYTYPQRPAVIQPQQDAPTETTPFNYTTPASVDTFSYRPDGQVLFARNRFAEINRGYDASNRLTFDSLSIQKADTTGYGSHGYAMRYKYDASGRRTRIKLPPLFTGTAHDSLKFAYYSWGPLQQLVEVNGQPVSFEYTTRGEWKWTYYVGGMSRYLSYDADGRLAGDLVQNSAGIAFPRPFDDSVRAGTNTYDRRDKLLVSRDLSRFRDSVTAAYSGLGYAGSFRHRQVGVTGITGDSALYNLTETLTLDGLGNTRNRTGGDSLFFGGAPAYRTSFSMLNFYESSSGRLTQFQDAGRTRSYVYDAAGQLVFDSLRIQSGAQSLVKEERAKFYGADGRLMAMDRRQPVQRTFEEYRYDPLGRRIWIRTARWCPGSTVNDPFCYRSIVRQVVWDGAEQRAEIQVPYDSANAAASEDDSSRAVVSYDNTALYDPNPFLGRVVYAPGLVLDQPAAISRLAYRDRPALATLPDTTWPAITIFPHWNSRGVPTQVTYASGAAWYTRQQPTPGGQMTCPLLADATTARCLPLNLVFGYSLWDQRRGVVQEISWHGSLLGNSRDGSGLEYKRNRVYDPETGRFTQDDPIGLAGGLNLYGFADGDPVNFSDPFGLYPICPSSRVDCSKQLLREWLAYSSPPHSRSASQAAGIAAGRTTIRSGSRSLVHSLDQLLDRHRADAGGQHGCGHRRARRAMNDPALHRAAGYLAPQRDQPRRVGASHRPARLHFEHPEPLAHWHHEIHLEPGPVPEVIHLPPAPGVELRLGQLRRDHALDQGSQKR